MAAHSCAEREAFNDLVDEEPLVIQAEFVRQCQAAIAAGLRDFEVIYDGVWKVVESGESAGLIAYDKAEAELEEVREGDAIQREAAANPARLFADAALAAPRFGCVVREVAKATGAKLEMSVLGQDINGEEQTGLKKMVRGPAGPRQGWQPRAHTVPSNLVVAAAHH